ncbi:MAG TPA: NAD(P)/FAD-dependent oxidoreductase [Acetivibrio sp.]|nr:NAD(P)/FAD-dependent oxidoreductase [Clostridium sp.]HOQ36593.1 NAD(P)/FAD-dependent oxidoreductase [Acetivibrio sp.]HPT90713.1 NAD(P)/FAD-dependent oxidoreductase [Acetivibrio sp.]HQA57573.1 NAD(P)/FAD-dependent oxidoreductase [Acetivibrio sp.]
MYDVIIVGKGPAGISASLYTARANLKTLVIGKGDSALKKAEKIENYYGFSQAIRGEDLLNEGEKQAARLGVQIIENEVINIEKNDFFEVLTPDNSYVSKSVLLATGQPLKKIRIENLEQFEGKGVSYCTTCDGFFYNNLKVGVLGYKDFVVHEAVELEAFTKDITIYTNGKQLELSEQFLETSKRFNVNTKEIYRIDGGDFLQRIFFKDGTSENIDGLFIAYESPSSVDFARKLGILVDENSIVVDRDQQTNIDGLFAAGDCTGGFKQISTAVGQGALAGRKIIEYVRSL